MDVVTITARPPDLRRPVLLAAFEGWNDAGEAASGALRSVRRTLRSTAFASVDPEEFFDFQLVRPTVRLDEASARVVEWPRNRFWWADLDGVDRHVVLLEGTEPNFRWRTFVGGIVDLAGELGVELVITLGALQVDLPHTRPVPVTGSASTAELARSCGLRPSTYEGPTGITGVLHQACTAAGLAAVSLWAGIPHYLAGTPYLAGSLSLAQRALGLLGADASLRDLAEETAAQRDDIEELLAEDEDLAAYVAELEQRAEAEVEVTEFTGPLATGEELAAEFERYLRDRDA